MACLGCHGPDGKGIAAAGFPRLAGLPASYLSKQLADFRSGSRKQAVMEPLAKALDEDEITAVSTYLASLPADPAPTFAASRSPMIQCPAWPSMAIGAGRYPVACNAMGLVALVSASTSRRWPDNRQAT